MYLRDGNGHKLLVKLRTQNFNKIYKMVHRTHWKIHVWSYMNSAVLWINTD